MNGPAMNGGANGQRGATLLPGFGAGLLGGLAMAVWMVASAAIDGMEPFASLRPIADTFSAAEPRGEGAGALAYALTLHMLFAGVIGIVLTMLLPRDIEPRFASVVCVGFAFGVMAIMTSYVLPAYSPGMRERMPELGGSWVIAHAAYGATVGFFAQRFRQRGRVANRMRTEERAHEQGRAPNPRRAAAVRR